jgi:endoglucanase
MASMTGRIKAFMLTVLLAAGFCASAAAAPFEIHRGINLDIWVTWPDESRWNDPEAILPFPEWRKSLDAEGLEALRAQGFDFVRMPVDPSPFLSPTAAPLRDRLLQSVRDSVHMVNAAGLKVVVDLHLFPAGGNRSIGMGQVMEDPALFDAYTQLVRDMGRLLAGEDPSLVAFELMNEPVIDCDDDKGGEWRDRQKRLFAAARASATRLTLVLTGGCYSGADDLAKVDPRDYPDDNLMWTFHSYEPFLLTHQGATWAGDFIPYVTGLPYPLHSIPAAERDEIVARIKAKMDAEAPWARRAGLKAYLGELIAEIDTAEKLDARLETPFQEAARWADANGIARDRVLLGEFGIIRQEWGNDHVVPRESRAAYYRDMARHAEAGGFPWAAWSYGGAFGIVEAFEGRDAGFLPFPFPDP